MALALYDRVQQTGTANTTVSFTLSGSVTGYQSFSVVGNGNTTYYGATDTSGNWEVGIGTYATGGTLTRTTILASSNSGSAVTFSGTVTVFVTYPSERSVNLDGSGNVSALGTISSGTWNGSTIPVAYGGTGVTASSGANSVMLRDANQNVSINRLNQSSTTTTAAGGTTTLTAASTFSQILNGTGGQTFKLPDATTLTNTTTFEFNNNATGTLTIVDNASGAVGTITAGGAAAIALLSNGTIAGSWDVHAYIPENVQWGTNSLALGSTVITGGTWNGGTIPTGYGGTGLTTFTAANNALYSTSSSALTAGTLPVAAGGTGATTLTQNGVVYGNGTSAAGITAAGTTGQVLIATTSGAPSWGSVPTTAAVTSFQTSLSGLTPSSATTGVVTLAGTLGVASGGTGATTLTGYVKGSGTSALTAASTIPTSDLTGTLGIGNGGTGQTTAAAAFNALNPMTTTGDLIYEASASTAARLAIGTTGQILTVAGGIPTWAANSGSTTLTTTSFTATSGQTSFTVTYTPALLEGVYRNGIRLGQADYTATSGTAIVLATGAITGDLLEVVAFSSLATSTAVNSISFGSTGLTPSTASTGAVTVAGTLAVANGGTGVTTSTGSGNNVLSASPTLSGTAVIPTINAGAATALTLQSASTTALTIDTSQNVGIGTTSPSSKLNVYSSTTNGGRIRITGTASTAGNYRGLELANGSGFSGGIFQDESVSGLSFWPVGTGETMRLDSSGNLGIGTSSPATKLEVSGQRIRINTSASDPGLELAVSSVVKGYVFYDTTNNVVTVRHASSTGINMDSSGNVGIGTSSPTGRLTVVSANGQGAANSAWSNAYSVFGPNASSTTGAALGLGYNTTSDASEIISLAPAVAWKPLNIFSNGINFYANAGVSNGSFSSSGVMTATSFSGAGTGLTGTASSLNIGGNAATVTNGVYTTSNQIVKAWVNFNSISGSSASVRGSYNVSSVTYRGTGQFTINFSSSLANANYSLAGMISDESAAAGMMYLTGTTGSASTSSVQVNTVNTGGALVNRTTNTAIIIN